jgi:hypothetical protein
MAHLVSFDALTALPGRLAVASAAIGRPLLYLLATPKHNLW